MSDMISKNKFAAHVKKIKVPEGFEASWEKAPTWGRDYQFGGWDVYVIKSSTIELKFDQTGTGHTNFLNPQTGVWHTFDQRGVSDSFTHLPWGKWDKTKYNLNEIVKEELERVAEQMKYYETAIPVPGLPGSHTVSPKTLEEMKKKLAKGQSIMFHPAGFGTGYEVSTHANRFSKPATKELCKFFGQDRLFVHSIEMD